MLLERFGVVEMERKGRSELGSGAQGGVEVGMELELRLGLDSFLDLYCSLSLSI